MFCIQHSAAAVAADTFRHRWHVMTDLKAFIYYCIWTPTQQQLFSGYDKREYHVISKQYLKWHQYWNRIRADCWIALFQIRTHLEFKDICWDSVHHLAFICLHPVHHLITLLCQSVSLNPCQNWRTVYWTSIQSDIWAVYELGTAMSVYIYSRQL